MISDLIQERSICAVTAKMLDLFSRSRTGVERLRWCLWRDPASRHLRLTHSERYRFCKCSSDDGCNFRQPPGTPQARKNSKIYELLAPPYPKSLRICNFYEILKISEDLVKSWLSFVKISAKNNEFQSETGKICEFRCKNARNCWRKFAKFLSLERCERMQIL